MGDPGFATCRSCGAEIFWLPMSTGKMHPVDAKADPEGNVAVVADKLVFGSAAKAAPEGSRYMSHFGTCPQAQKWSKRP